MIKSSTNAPKPVRKFVDVTKSEIPLNMITEFEKRKQNREKYTEFIRSRIDLRITRRQMKEVLRLKRFANDIDLGIEPGSGLDSPEPLVRVTEEKLYIPDQYEIRSGHTASISVKKPRKFDENKLVKKKFKSVPTTEQEIRECSLKLSTRQLEKIPYGPKIMDFGKQSVFAHAVKNFSIRNELKQNILVRVASQKDEVKITPNAQVIPPLSSTGFDVEFCSQMSQLFQHTVQLVINEQTKIKFVIVAEVVPLEVVTSTNEIKFRFNEFNLESSITETVSMTNKGNSTAYFEWKRVVLQPETPDQEKENNAIITINPSKGEIEPHKTKIVEVTFTPSGTSNQFQHTFKLHVKGSAEDKTLICSADIKESKLAFVEKKVDFGVIPVGLRKTKTVTLKNIGDNAGIFHIINLHPDLKVTPMKGRIAKNTFQKLQIELKPSSAQVCDTFLHVNVRGGKSLKFPIKGEAKIPTVQLDAPEIIDFGAAFVGSSLMQKLVIKNVGGNIPAVMYLDLSKYTDFSLADDKGKIVTETTDSLPIFIVPPEEPEEEGEEETSEVEEQVGEDMERTSDVGDEDDIGKKYQLSVPPNQDLSFYIVFHPKQVQNYQFHLDFNLAGIPTALYTRVIKAEALKPRLVISHPTINFKNKVIIKEGMSMMPHRMLITFTNEDNKELKWEFDEMPAEFKKIFRMEPTSGRLIPGHVAQIQVFFTPRELKHYQTSLSIFLDDNKKRSYFDLVLKGMGSNPNLSFDVKEIVLPIVPLGVAVTEVFHIINEGYEDLTLEYSLPIDTNKIPLTLKFLEGTRIGRDRQSLPVEVSFISKKPISFTARVDFFDTEKNRFSISITATADNCILTNYPFMANNKDTYMILEPTTNKEPLIYVSKTRENMDSARKPSGPPSIYSGTTACSSLWSGNEKNLRFIFTKRSAERLLHYLNTNVLTNPLEELVKTLVFSNGRILCEIIENVSGKKISNIFEEKLPEDRIERIKMRVSQYEKVLTFLKEYGALLNMINPEFMLKYEDYQALQQHQELQNPEFMLLDEKEKPKKLSERRFRYRSNEAWMTIIYQIIRVFILSRVNAKQLKTLPGMKIDLTAQPFHHFYGSNIYSPAETILLNWMTFHYKEIYPQQAKILTNFKHDLCTSVVFAALLQSHIPSLAPRFESLRHEFRDMEDYEHNAQLVISAMKDCRMDYTIKVRDIVHADPRDMVLFSMYLFNTLPNYVPKTTVEFKGSLQQKITKFIELTNSTKHQLEYLVSLEGSDVFKIKDDRLVLNAKGQVNYAVECIPKFSAPAEARLTFYPQRSGFYHPNPMVFILKTCVIPDVSDKTVKITSEVYEAKRIEIEVENTYEHAGHFQVNLHSVRSVATDLPDPFYTPCEYLTMKQGEKKKLPIQFLSFKRGTFECRIILLDPKVGEFVYAVEATAELPAPAVESVKINAEANGSAKTEVIIPFKNQNIEKGLKSLKERFKKLKIGETISPLPDPDEITFKVECTSPYYSAPPTFTIKKNAQKPDLLPLTFNPKQQGLYPCKLILESHHDTRVFQVEGKARAVGVNVEIEFLAPVRKQILQNIPITNKTSKPWKILATLTGDYFSGPTEVNVVPGKTVNYPLVYCPRKMHNTTGELILFNPETSEKYIYSLRGNVEDPLAEEKIKIKCQARETVSREITVPNITGKDVNYKVEIDLPFVKHPGTLAIQRKVSSAIYSFSLTPPHGGKFDATITFIAEDNEIVWYVLQIDAAKPPPEGTIQIESQIRQSAKRMVPITNPLDEEVEFEVKLDGHGLLGEHTILLKPKESGRYELNYAPLQVGKQTGSISFYNSKAGEFWYQLELVAKQPPPMIIPEFKSEIGKRSEYKISIQNPVGEEIILETKISNRQNFAIVPEKLILAPFETIKANIQYIPSSIDKKERATITLSHPRVGDWVYHCTGVGLRPTKMDPIQVMAKVTHTTTSVVTFRNPFPTTKSVFVKLYSTFREGEIFNLILKQEMNTLAPFSMIQIPFTFSPSMITNYSAEIVVQVQGEDLAWRYPIIGIAEAFTSQYFSFKCQARSSIEEEIEVVLSGLDLESIGNDEFTHQLRFPEQEYLKAIKRSIQVVQLDHTIPSEQKKLKFKVLFAPLRPFDGLVELIIQKKGGGIWRYNIQLEATIPDVDDVIEIEAAIRKTERVSFRLNNIFAHTAKFEAYFTSDSPLDFQVQPDRGVLAAYGYEGTQFVVSYTANHYGKVYVGTLIIDTDEMQWRYEVHGILPKYVVPKQVQSKIENRLSHEVQMKLKKSAKKNFVKANMEQVQSLRRTAVSGKRK